MFKFLKKGDAVPDVGQEEAFEKKKKGKKKVLKKVGSDKSLEAEENVLKKEIEKIDGELGSAVPVQRAVAQGVVTQAQGFNNDANKFEFDKINARIEAMSALIKGFGERFSNLSQQIGEVRAMNLTTEKNMSKIDIHSSKAIDLVKEVKPEKLRLDYQRLELKMSTFVEKLEANKQFQETILKEVKDLRKKAGIFVGTDALLKLNEEVKNDLVELQRMGSRVRLNADKSEQLFVELKRGFAESQKMHEVFNTLDNSYAGLKEELEKLKLDHSQVIKESDFNDFKKTFNNKFSLVEGSLENLETLKKNTDHLSNLIETAVLMAKKNQESIGDLAISVGDNKIKKVSDYENQIVSVLGMIEKIAEQISEIKKKVGMKSTKILVKPVKKKLISPEKLKLPSQDLTPSEIKKSIKKVPEIRESIKKVPEIKHSKKKVLKKTKPVKKKLHKKKKK